MMSIGNVLQRYAAEIGLLSVLAVLPYLVALREVGLTLLILGLSIGGYRLLKKRLTSRICVDGKSVFITGCDTGFGNALARRLVSLGFRVFAGCFRPDEDGAQALKASCGDPLHIVPLDVTSDDSVAEALKYVKGHLEDKGLWGLVNNAGQSQFGDAEMCTMSVYKRTMEVNLFGVVRVTKAFLPLIRQTAGRIVNVTSIKGRIGIPQTAAYTTSKYAGEGFANVLRMEMRQWGVKVVIIEPGNYGGATDVFKAGNLRRIQTDLDDMWEEATPEVKEDYGHDYHYNVLSAIRGLTSLTTSSAKPVIDAMEDGLLNEDPNARYMVGGSNEFHDIFKTIAVLCRFLPEYLADFLIEKYLTFGNVRPRALTTR